MFTAPLFIIAKSWNQPESPSMIHWTRKMWHIYTMEFMSFVGTWMNLETDTRTENEIPHILTHRRVMKNGNTWTQRGEHYTLGSLGGNRGGTVRGGELRRDSMGRNARYR